MSLGLSQNQPPPGVGLCPQIRPHLWKALCTSSPGKSLHLSFPGSGAREGSEPSLPGRVFASIGSSQAVVKCARIALVDGPARSFPQQSPSSTWLFPGGARAGRGLKSPNSPFCCFSRSPSTFRDPPASPAWSGGSPEALTRNRVVRNLSQPPRKHHEEDLSTKSPPTKSSPRFQTPHAHPSRARHSQGAS